jgi:hypothetical protein
MHSFDHKDNFQKFTLVPDVVVLFQTEMRIWIGLPSFGLGRDTGVTSRCQLTGSGEPLMLYSAFYRFIITQKGLSPFILQMDSDAQRMLRLLVRIGTANAADIKHMASAT